MCRRVCDFSLTANNILFFWHVLPLLRQDRSELTGSEVWGGSGKVLLSGLAQ